MNNIRKMARRNYTKLSKAEKRAERAEFLKMREERRSDRRESKKIAKEIKNINKYIEERRRENGYYLIDEVDSLKKKLAVKKNVALEAKIEYKALEKIISEWNVDYDSLNYDRYRLSLCNLLNKRNPHVIRKMEMELQCLQHRLDAHPTYKFVTAFVGAKVDGLKKKKTPPSSIWRSFYKSPIFEKHLLKVIYSYM